jgi:predicted NBD/HSP70 family sugar kinase
MHENSQNPLIGEMDIGGTKVAIGIINSDGRVLARRKCPTDADRSYADALQRIIEMLPSHPKRRTHKSPALGSDPPDLLLADGRD